MNKILVTILIFVLGITNLYSQNSVLEKQINIHAKNVELVSVLKQISKQTGYYFTYNPKIVSEKTIINYQAKNISTKNILKNILSDSSLTYSVIDNHIIICKNNNSNLICKNKNTFNDSIIKISGKVINTRTLKPIPFASIGILNTTFGTVSNENGLFNLKIDKKYTDSTLFIANISYKTLLISIKKIKRAENTFRLSQDFVSIQEVIIRSHDPIIILDKAIEKIKENYIQNTSILTAFYREGVVNKKSILNLSEAVINIYKTPYKPTIKTEKIKVYKSRKIRNTLFTDTLLIKLKGGLYSSLQLDIVKHPIDFLTNITENNYEYQITDIVTFGDKLAYVIDFKQKENIQDALYKGKIYIETKHYAIIACDFEFNFDVIGNKPNFVLKKKLRAKVRTQSAKYHITYRNINGNYFLNHVRADINIKIKKHKQLFYKQYNTFLETVIFDIDTINIKKFQRKDVEKKNRVFIDNHYSYDANFWGENNFIKPESTIEDALSKIKVKLKLF